MHGRWLDSLLVGVPGLYGMALWLARFNLNHSQVISLVYIYLFLKIISHNICKGSEAIQLAGGRE